MTTINPSDLAAIISALSPAMQTNIMCAGLDDPQLRRGVDFDLIARAEAAAARLVAAIGPDVPLGIPGVLSGMAAGGLLAQVRGVAQQAQPFREQKARRAQPFREQKARRA